MTRGVFGSNTGLLAREPPEIVHETVTVCRPEVRQADPRIDAKMSRQGPKNLDPKILRRTVCPGSWSAGVRLAQLGTDALTLGAGWASPSEHPPVDFSGP